MTAPLDIQLSTRRHATDDDYDDYDAENGGFPGDNYDSMDVEPGEEFIIAKHLNASVNCDDTPYVLRKTGQFGSEAIRGEGDLFLKPGRYRFHEDGLTIERL